MIIEAFETLKHELMRGDYSRLYFLIANIEVLEANRIEGAFAALGPFEGPHG